MKAERKEEEKWVPIVITLESKEEAQYLWHCLNRPSNVIESGCSKRVPFPQTGTDYDMFGEIDKFVNSLE